MISRRVFAASGAAVATAAAMVSSAQAQGADSTMERIKSSKTLRIAALPGEAPYFNKDIATGAWTGMCIDMAKDIAANFDANVDYVESTYGNSVLDLQAGKIDLAFALNPTPKRAMVIDFTHAFYMHGFGMVGRKGFTAANWADLDKPEVKVCFDIGSAHEISARRFAPKAQLIALKTRDECVLAVQSGRADCVVMAVNLGLTAVKKNPSLGQFQMLHQPRIQLPTCMGVRKETNKDWVSFLNAWVDYNRGIQQIREWLYGGLAINGVKPDDVPADVEL
ncbi:MAG: transporter substrate-binding domain-containing protein [Alphaproteobacteria bacterium]|nr:transporter substrate-binding domain-containing protein [Alphaproteobacteria bacterium]